MALTAKQKAFYDYAISEGKGSVTVSPSILSAEEVAQVNAELAKGSGASSSTTADSSQSSNQATRHGGLANIDLGQPPSSDVPSISSPSSTNYTIAPAPDPQAVENLADLIYRSMTTGVSTTKLNEAIAAAGGDPNDPSAANKILEGANYAVGDLRDFYTSAGDEPDDPQAKKLYEARDRLLADGTNSNLQNLAYLKSQGVDVDTRQYSPQAQQQIQEAFSEFVVSDLSPEETQRYNELNALYKSLFGRDIALEGVNYWVRGDGSSAPITEKTLVDAAQGADLNYYNTFVAPKDFSPEDYTTYLQDVKGRMESGTITEADAYTQLFQDVSRLRNQGYNIPDTDIAQYVNSVFNTNFTPEQVTNFMETGYVPPDSPFQTVGSFLETLTPEQIQKYQELNDLYIDLFGRNVGLTGAQYWLTGEGSTVDWTRQSLINAAQGADLDYYTTKFGSTDGSGGIDSREATSGSIVPGQPQVGEVNIMDYMGLQAGTPTLPVGTQLATDLQQLEATDQTLQALTPEQKLATEGEYVATPQEITASTVTAPTPTDAVTATASTTDLVEQPEAAKMTAEKSLDQINKEADALQAARQDLNEIDPKATVQGQLALLQEQFADGEVPVWASGAFRQVNALMAQRGLGGSTIAAEAITNALMQSALPIAQQDASFYQNVTIQNLSNEQQAEMAKFNARTSAIFNDQAAENAARSLNTQSENELSRFFAELAQNVALSNTAQVNSMEQFNATAQNQMTQFFEELGLTAETFNADALNELATFNAEQGNIIAQFNASLDNQREQFNVQNQLAIDASNVQWRRDVNTANTSSTNAALQFDAQNLLGIQQTALNNIWQHYDTILNYAYQSEQNEIDRAYQLMLTSMSQEFQRSVQEDSDLMGLVSSGVKSAAIIASSPSGRDWVSDLFT